MGDSAAVLLAALLAGLFWFVVADVAVAAVNYLRGRAEAGGLQLISLGAGHAAGALVLVALYRFAGLRHRLAGLVRPFETVRGVFALLAGAAAVRLGWVIAVPTPAYSDGAAYSALARILLETGAYDNGESQAYWPPGYPFWIAGVYAVFGRSLLAVKVSAIILAGLSEWFCWVWVKRYANRRTAALAVLLLVCWPSRTLHLDILSYDDLVVATVLLSLVLLPDPRAGKQGAGSWWRWLLAGLVLGGTCFVRSTLALVVPAVGVWMVLQRVRLHRALAATAVYGAAMLLALVPWTVRNYSVFNAFVPLTTNAGWNFYNSFAPGGDGGFYGPGKEALQEAAGAEADDELARNATAFRLAFETIHDDPWRATYRALVQKPILYLGSDNVLAWVDAYQAIWPNHPLFASALKAAGLFFCNAYYVVLMLCPLLFVRRVAACLRERPAAALCLMVFLSGLFVHTLFEAQARYHLIYTPFWTMCLAIMLGTAAPKRGASSQTQGQAPAF